MSRKNANYEVNTCSFLLKEELLFTPTVTMEYYADANVEINYFINNSSLNVDQLFLEVV